MTLLGLAVKRRGVHDGAALHGQLLQNRAQCRDLIGIGHVVFIGADADDRELSGRRRESPW